MNNYNNLNIKNEEEFQRLMNDVEEELKNDEIPIRNRAMHAWDRISSKHMFGLPFPKSNKKPTPNSYSGEDLSILIFDWYEKKYGNRLVVDLCWKIAVLIRGDIYAIKLPLRLGARGINIFNLIDGLTEGYAKLLTIEEITKLVEIAQLGFRARNCIEGKYENLLINKAIGDIEASVAHLLAQSPQYGLSKWSSLQATEKTLKSFIDFKNKPYPTRKDGHNLSLLATLANKYGLVLPNENLLGSIQCQAGIRYGSLQVSAVEAIQAHHACLAICSDIAEQIQI